MSFKSSVSKRGVEVIGDIGIAELPRGRASVDCGRVHGFLASELEPFRCHHRLDKADGRELPPGGKARAVVGPLAATETCDLAKIRRPSAVVAAPACAC
jgi:hypothetical protein